MKRWKPIVTLCVLVFISMSLCAQLSVDKIFSDHMVLQRNKPVLISGRAIPYSHITIQFSKQRQRTITRKDSTWSVLLDPLAASATPADIIVRSGRQKFSIKNVLVGDIWLCLGQSNMEWPMQLEQHYPEYLQGPYLQGADLGGTRWVRFLDPVYAGQGIFGQAFSDSVKARLNPRDFYQGQWAVCDSASIKGMTAVGYYFGKTIADETGIPIGLINLSIGGAPIETFISRETLHSDERFSKKLRGNWLENSFMPEWVRQRGKENSGRNSVDPSGPNHAFKPGFAFDAGIRPLKDLPIKGIIWYQGESNAQETDRVQEYAALQELLVHDLRKNWNDSALPFYYVQLSSIDSVKYRSQLWPMFRDEQRKFMSSVPHSGMAVSHDHGALNDVHPRNKKIIGERLSRWALKYDYGKQIIPSGPLPTHAVQEDSVVRIYFNYASSLVSVNGPLKGFSLDGVYETRAMIENSTVLIPNAGNAKWVYYGWRPFTDANLANSAGLPAPGFKIPVSAKPALLPLPKQLQWTHQRFDLNQYRNIRILGSDMEAAALLFKKHMSDRGVEFNLALSGGNSPFVLFRLGHSVRNKEGYRISVKRDSIVVSASSSKGAYYALQTMLQLIEGDHIRGCEIQDWPAFPWRGYMVDVGRNFQSVGLLKQQIDIMSKYKLNIFHFHLTEDIAWRIEIPGFPQLTKAETMIRNKGSFYSVEEMKDLIRYCRERNITMVPEIDMPGHSAAFARAMGVDMQSKEGKAIMKKILKIFCDTYDLEYIHIGGDEVKITDTSFLPDMISYLKSRNKKVIGWDPGGNLGNDVIRQLWMTEGPKNAAIQYIDSRHLYLNHMDPLESVTTIFHRKIGDTDSASVNVPGATICLWHDRNVNRESDLLIMNPVYPAMLAFAEKSWHGGGYPHWITNTIDPKAFGEFEARLLDHKQTVFKNLPFSYWKQSDIGWKLYGPYNNEGNLSSNFAPDTTLSGIAPAQTVNGGTVVLRHFWDPVVRGVLNNAKENTTWYASTEFWSDADTTANFRIGFNNFSRSYVTDSPAEGTWNNLQSKIFINGREITPPHWKQAGVKGQLELPLIDEGYEYREPHRIPMKKGWNKVLLKLPVGSFKGPGFGNPVKWMFTVVKDE